MAAPAFGTIGTQLQGSGSTMNVAVPASVAANDIVVVSAFLDTAGATVTALASGFAHAPDSPITGPDNHSMVVMWKRATGSDTGTYDFTLSGSVYRNAACARYTGVITSGSPWDVTNGVGSNTSTTTTEDVADTTTESDTLGVWAGTNWSGGTWTPPSGYTERRDTGDGVCSSADKVYASAGATGAIVGTCTGSDKRCAWFGALRSTGGAAASNPPPPIVAPGRAARMAAQLLRRRPNASIVSRAPAAITAFTGTIVETQDNQTSVATGVLGYTGTITETQDNQTSAASGWISVFGTIVETQANQTMAASGTFSAGGAVTGTIAETQDNQTSAATGVLGYSGTLARTQANQTMAATGVLGYSGTLARTQANQTMAASGTFTGTFTGTLARTQANQTMAASGWITVTGTLARIQGNQTMSASGTVSGVLTPLRTLVLYATRTFGADGYHANENHLVFLPTRLKVGAPLVVVCHGTAAEASYYYANRSRYRPLEELANTGLVVIAPDLGEPAIPDGWGNDRSVAAVGEVITWAAATYRCDTSRVYLIGDSAGGPTALNWARANNSRVAAIALRAGVCDIESIYQAGAGNPLLVSLINQAYAVGGGWPAQRATHDPALNTGQLVPIADRIRCYYTPNDDLIPPAGTIAFANTVGCELVPVGSMPHQGDEIGVAVQDGDLANWFWSHH